MFGIGGGELIFILFIVLMLFGSDKVPEIARTMGKAMAQLKNATNDIKYEIQKGAEENGFDQKTLNDLSGGITNEIEKAKQNILGDTGNSLTQFSTDLTSDVNSALDVVVKSPQTDQKPNDALSDDYDGPIKRQS